ncbi:hypothetical protein DNU06_02830 [Putridiphycobacter roseus]|uniref:Uncharacterized protein n=1 Tax=Putridiphycobacter roseus TaxID=2219161 RepID=A0A2W1N6K3_9FLAO|nr:hypothetical protein [Putridiphycobacter roseus]PZE18781.1 hypothetical protein DNU06_02830 [Putridiphycobacter roseus]
MIQYFSVLFIGLFCLTVIGPLVTVGNFYANQAAIEKAYCENKDKPALHCNGHCYLKKELKKLNPTEEQEFPNEIKVPILLPIAFERIMAIDFSLIELQTKAKLFKQYINEYEFLGSEYILDPPEILFI